MSGRPAASTDEGACTECQDLWVALQTLLLRQATSWHNHLFNPNLPPAARILAFTPDWKHASGRKIEEM